MRDRVEPSGRGSPSPAAHAAGLGFRQAAAWRRVAASSPHGAAVADSLLDAAADTVRHWHTARPAGGSRGGAGRRRTGPKPAEGRSRRTRGGSGPTTSILSAGGAFTNQMTAETLGVRADIACVLYICTWAVTTIQKCC